MAINQFEDILAWQKSKDLTALVYANFKNFKDYAFKDQICRASVSIMNNIAEGFERQSNKELKHYLFMAKGSCGEVRSMLHLAGSLNYLNEKVRNNLTNKALEISKMLSGFIKQL